MAIPAQIEKCKGAMLATAIGDALGWPNEPRSKSRIKKPGNSDGFVEWIRSSTNPCWHDEKILPGEYSDDTQLTLSVARSIIAGDWVNYFAKKELPFWLNYERGGGGALLKAAQSCKNGRMLWQCQYNKDYFNAGGNGAVMRILPHVIASANRADTTELMLDVIKDTLITHGHPRAFLGAACYAYALDYLLRKNTVLEYGELVDVVIDGQNVWGAALDPEIFGKWLNIANQCCKNNFSTELENVRGRMVRQFEFIGDSLKKGLLLDDIKILMELGCFDKVNGAGDVAILSAVYLTSRYANNPSLGIKTAAFLSGADTDTIASITGGLLGMLNGMSWIPAEWRKVQDYNCLIQMAELLLERNRQEDIKTEVEKEKLQNNQWNVSPIGKMKLIESRSVLGGKNNIVMIKKWQTSFGQTLYTKSFRLRELPKQSQQIEKQAISHQQPSQKESKKFVLDLIGISDLLENSNFKTNVTIGKVLKIVKDLINGQETNKTIAKKYNVEQAFVEEIEKYIK